MSDGGAMRAAFLDRDGVINVDHGYVHRPEDFTFIDGVFEGCRHLQSLGYALIVITNQSGIARGMFSEADFRALTDWMTARFAEEGVVLTAVYFCPHHPDYPDYPGYPGYSDKEQSKGPAPYRHDCDCRKPAPGMLLQAIREYGIDPARSLMLGDKGADMQAATAAGVGRRILVRSGQAFTAQDAAQADEVWDSLHDALSHVTAG